jgi:RNA polymerase-binding transcription factor DksA
MRTRLERERASLRSQLEEHGADPDDPQSVGLQVDEGFADSAHATAERAGVLSLVEGLRQSLAEVDAALGRIEAGTYGTCERCGRDIGAERLEAIPSARFDIACQQEVGR